MRYYGVPREGVAAGTLVQKGLCTETAAKCNHAAISTHEKERLCIALSLFVVVINQW